MLSLSVGSVSCRWAGDNAPQTPRSCRVPPPPTCHILMFCVERWGPVLFCVLVPRSEWPMGKSSPPIQHPFTGFINPRSGGLICTSGWGVHSSLDSSRRSFLRMRNVPSTFNVVVIAPPFFFAAQALPTQRRAVASETSFVFFFLCVVVGLFFVFLVFAQLAPDILLGFSLLVFFPFLSLSAATGGFFPQRRGDPNGRVPFSCTHSPAVSFYPRFFILRHRDPSSIPIFSPLVSVESAFYFPLPSPTWLLRESGCPLLLTTDFSGDGHCLDIGLLQPLEIAPPSCLLFRFTP